MADRKPYRRIVKTDGLAQDDHDVVDKHADALDVSPAGGALMGLDNGMLLGHGDEVYGGLSAAVDQVTEPDADFWADYRKHRDDGRRLNDRARTQQPTAHFVGDVAGDTLTNAGLAIATAGQSLTPQAQGLVGAVRGFGDNASDLSTLDGVEQAGKDAAVGGVSRAAMTKVVGSALARMRGKPAQPPAPDLAPPPDSVPTRVDGSLAADAAKAAVNPHAEHVLAQADKMKALLAARKAAKAAGGASASTGDDAADAMLGDMARQTLAGKPPSTPLAGPVGADNPAAGRILSEAQRIESGLAGRAAAPAPVPPKAVQRVADLLDNDPDFAAQFGDELMEAAQRGQGAITDTIRRLSTNPSFSSALESTRALRPTKP